MGDEMKESQSSWFRNLFILPSGRKIPAWLVLIPVVLVVGAFVRHLYQESFIRPTVSGPLSPALEAGLETAPTVATPEPSPPLEIKPMPLSEEKQTVYSVRVGQGRQMDFVNRALTKLKSDQHNAFYQKVGDQYWILVGRFSDPTTAESQLKSIRASGKYKGEIVTLSEADVVKPQD